MDHNTTGAFTPNSGSRFASVRKMGRGAPLASAAHFSLRRVVRNLILMAVDFVTLGLTLVLAYKAIGRHSYPGGQVDYFAIALFAGASVLIFFASGLYRRSWRFFSFAHAVQLAVASVPSFAISWALIWFFPAVQAESGHRVDIALAQWLFGVAALLITRGFRRALRERLNHAARQKTLDIDAGHLRYALLVGSPDWVLSVIGMLKREGTPTLAIAGILLPADNDTLLQIAEVPILGSHEDIAGAVKFLEARGRRPSLIIACDDGTHLSNREMARLASHSRSLKIEMSRVRECWSHILQSSPGTKLEDLSVKDLLGRSEIALEGQQITDQIAGQCVLVTGAGGTIGGELCSQLASFNPARLVLLEHSEYHLYAIEMKLREQYPELDIQPALCNICDRAEVRRVFDRHRPAIIYHAAALKHVPVVEANPCAGVHTNIVGTRIIADAVCEFSARAMVQVSTDKAVNPVGMMGATKRVGELYSQALDMCGVDDPKAPRFMTVRFGNVLGSSGSIVPLFHRQLREGRPLTVTHPDIERFFMTVREAVQLILQSSSCALSEELRRGTIFVLDMGKSVRIVDLAYRMIQLYGLQPEIDVPIEFVGLRPGEKLFEELFDVCERQLDSPISGIFEAQSRPIPLPLIMQNIDKLAAAVERGDDGEVRRITHTLVKIPSGASPLTAAEIKPDGIRSGEPVNA